MKRNAAQPFPHILARTTRALLVDTILSISARSIRAFLHLVQYIYREHIVHPNVPNGDTKTGMEGRITPSIPPEQQAEFQFRQSLAKVFGNSRLNDVVMGKIISCTGGFV